MCTDERICFASCRHELKRRADFFFSLSFIFFAGGERKLALYVTRENNLVYLGFWSHEALEVKRARGYVQTAGSSLVKPGDVEA